MFRRDSYLWFIEDVIRLLDRIFTDVSTVLNTYYSLLFFRLLMHVLDQAQSRWWRWRAETRRKTSSKRSTNIVASIVSPQLNLRAALVDYLTISSVCTVRMPQDIQCKNTNPHVPHPPTNWFSASVSGPNVTPSSCYYSSFCFWSPKHYIFAYSRKCLYNAQVKYLR